MRYVLAGLVVFAGVMLFGLSYHNHLKEAWEALSK